MVKLVLFAKYGWGMAFVLAICHKRVYNGALLVLEAF